MSLKDSESEREEGAPVTQKPDDPQVEVVEIYRQYYAYLIKLNDTYNQLTPFYASIIGVIWYFSVSWYDTKPAISTLGLLFTAALSVGYVSRHDLIVKIGNRYRAGIANIEGRFRIGRPDDHQSSLTVFTGLGLVIGITSLIGAAICAAHIGHESHATSNVSSLIAPGIPSVYAPSASSHPAPPPTPVPN